MYQSTEDFFVITVTTGQYIQFFYVWTLHVV